MKKVIKIIILIIVILPIFYGIFFTVQNYTIKSALERYNEAKLDENHALIRCNYSIMAPEFAYVFFAMNQGHISFDKLSKIFWNSNDWESSYTGGTTVKNTTFPELVKMVKEDCKQFQEGGRQGETEWIHTPAPTRDEIKKDKIDFLERIFYGLGSRANEKFIEIYGDINNMTDEEKVKLRDEIEEKGLDPAVENLRQVEETRRGLAELTDNQQKAIRQKYGDWKGLSDDELLEWMKIIDKDYEEGKFNLDDY